MSDIILTIGPRSCGKSEVVENDISKIAKKLYIGTLWPDHRFHSLIKRHLKRRDHSWILYEVEGNIRKDCCKIDTLLAEIKKISHPVACLIDGLTTWALHCSLKKGTLDVSAYNVVFFLEKLITAHTECVWRLVDVSPQSFSMPHEKMLFSACQNIHFLLSNNIKDLKVYNW